MATRIRLQRHGSTHTPIYRMVVAESTSPRDGRFIEVLGTYNPHANKAEDEVNVKIDRVDHWISVGSKPSDTAKTLIKKARNAKPAEAVEVAPAETVKVAEPVEAAEPVDAA